MSFRSGPSTEVDGSDQARGALVGAVARPVALAVTPTVFRMDARAASVEGGAEQCARRVFAQLSLRAKLNCRYCLHCVISVLFIIFVFFSIAAELPHTKGSAACYVGEAQPIVQAYCAEGKEAADDQIAGSMLNIIVEDGDGTQ